MDLVVDDEHLGRPETSWRDSGRHATLAPLELSARRVILIAPHPDDEVLGAGGIIQAALASDIPVQVFAVTDGEGSHPHSEVSKSVDFGSVRSRESCAALRRIGWVEPRIIRLHLPDGMVAQHRAQLDEALANVVRPGDLCVAPWRRDGHPDHDACGESALEACQAMGASAMGYLVWAWHWADPDGSDIPWDHCKRLDLSRRERARKRWAIGAFESQTHPIGPDAADAPVLPAPILRRFWRNYEVYVDEMAVA
jgi:LmbE family N-acetylglucosaminyl deacetylase